VAETRYEAVVRLLLEKGGDVEVKDKEGTTPLHLAAKNGHHAVVRLPLEKGPTSMRRAKSLVTRCGWLHTEGTMQSYCDHCSWNGGCRC